MNRSTFLMRKPTGLYPSLRVAGSGQRVVSMGGSVLLVTTATTVGLDRTMSAVLGPWRHPMAVHDPGKVLLDLAIAVVTSSTDPPIDTTRCPEPATRNDGYKPVGFRIRKVLRFMQGYGHQIPTFLQVRAPFPMINTPPRNSGVKARG